MSQQQNYNYRQHVNSILQAPTAQFPDRTFTLKQLLGEGGEGGVYLANPQKWGNCTTQVVLKLQLKMKEQEMEFIDNIKKYQEQYEIPNTPQYRPSYIIRIYERFQWRGMEVTLMEKGEIDLYNYLQQNFKQLTIQDKIRICQQVFYPIFFLNSQRLLHRDIKPDNYVKVGNDFKLIDFGLVKQNQESKTIAIGSKLYQAPELIENGVPTLASDVWSLGCLFYEIFTGLSIYQKDSETSLDDIIKTLEQNKRNQKFFDTKIAELQIPEEIKKVLKLMLCCDETKRASLDEINTQLPKQQQPAQQNNNVFQTQINTKAIQNKFPNTQFQQYAQFPQNTVNVQELLSQSQQQCLKTNSEIQQKLNSNLQLSIPIIQTLQTYQTTIQSMISFLSQQQQSNAFELYLKQFDQYLVQVQQLQIPEWFQQIQQLSSEIKILILQQDSYNKLLKVNEQYQKQVQAQQLTQTQLQSQLYFQTTQFQTQIASFNQIIQQQSTSISSYEIQIQELKNELLRRQSEVEQNNISQIPQQNSQINSNQENLINQENKSVFRIDQKQQQLQPSQINLIQFSESIINNQKENTVQQQNQEQAGIETENPQNQDQDDQQKNENIF